MSFGYFNSNEIFLIRGLLSQTMWSDFIEFIFVKRVITVDEGKWMYPFNHRPCNAEIYRFLDYRICQVHILISLKCRKRTKFDRNTR